MLVLGPTLSFDVPGFLNVGVHELWESNAPYDDYSQTGVPRYHYKAHPMLASSWSIPHRLAAASASRATPTSSPPRARTSSATRPRPRRTSTREVMWNAGGLVGAKPNTWRVGVEYEYWKNKFGNSWHGPAGHGAFAETPMVRAEVPLLRSTRWDTSAPTSSTPPTAARPRA